MILTKHSVERLSLPTGKSELIVFDDKLSGFGVRVRKGGKRTWIAQYRVGRQQRRQTIGSVEVLDAEKARSEFKKISGRVAAGHDPQAEKRNNNARANLTLLHVAATYLEAVKPSLRPRSYEEIERHLKVHWKPLANASVLKMSRADVAGRLAELASDRGQIAANRARSSLSAMFVWAIKKGIADANPVIGTERTEERARVRVLSDAELVEIWGACRDDGYGGIVKLLLLTGQRRDEIGSLKWSEVDLEKRTITLPGARTKNGKPHEIPLCDAAVAILKGQPRQEGRDPVFGGGANGFNGWSKSKKALDKRIAEARAEDKSKNEDKKKNIAAWCLHDLRRTMVTGLNEIGILPHVVEALVNHVSGFRGGIAGVYNLALYRPEKRQAADRWAAHIEGLVSGRASNVIAMPKAAAGE